MDTKSLTMAVHSLYPLAPLPPPPGESPVPPPSTVSSSALSASSVNPPPQPKQGNSSQQDRKVPPPIGTERLARIRQTGSVNTPLLTTSYTASVGQGGIWSFGVGSASGERRSLYDVGA
jgi:ankyrin repeat domain-containing protein 17